MGSEMCIRDSAMTEIKGDVLSVPTVPADIGITAAPMETVHLRQVQMHQQRLLPVKKNKPIRG